MNYRKMLFNEIKNFARFKRGALKYNDPVDIFHMMRCVQLSQQCFDSLSRFNKISTLEYEHIYNLIEKMSEQAFAVAVTIRVNIWDSLKDQDIHYIIRDTDKYTI